MTQQLGPRQEAWLAALESGEFTQTRNWLERDGKFCCLGVACCVAANEVDINCLPSGEIEGCTLTVQTGVAEYYELSKSALITLIGWNDNDSVPFGEIASRVRSDPGKFFLSPA